MLQKLFAEIRHKVNLIVNGQRNSNWGDEARKAANENLRKQGYKTMDWGDEMRESFNKKLREGKLPDLY